MTFKNSDHIDIERLRKYYNGELSDFQRNALEQEALDDPFLKEAMDGFDANPNSFNKFYKKNKPRLSENRGYTLLIGAITLALLFTITLIRKQFIPTPQVISGGVEHVIPDTTIDYEENFDVYEVIPQELDTLHTIAANEIITSEEIKANKKEIELPKKDVVQNITKDTILPVQINDPVIIDDEYTIEEEDIHRTKNGEAISSKYLYNLYTVDYSQIRSEHELRYTRFEMGGTPASEEGNSNTSNLIETEVEIPYFIYLRKSMESFSKNQYKRALNRYLTILEQYPNDLNALFYGGLSFFNLGKYEDAYHFFSKINEVKLDAFKQEAEWYKAKSLIKLKRIPEAKEVLDTIIMQGEFYVEDAILLKKEL